MNGTAKETTGKATMNWILNKNTGITLGLVVILCSGVGTASFTFGSWKAERAKDAENMIRLERKIDTLTTEIKDYAKAHSAVNGEISLIKSRIELMTERVETIDHRGTTRLQQFEQKVAEKWGLWAEPPLRP